MAQDRLLPDINNVLGRVVANLHLGLADLEDDHPARQHFDVVNSGLRDLRSLVAELGEARRNADP